MAIGLGLAIFVFGHSCAQEDGADLKLPVP